VGDLYICGITTYDGFPKIFDAGYVECKYLGQKNYQQLGELKSNLNFIRNQFLDARDWPFGAAASVAMMILMALMMVAYFASIRKIGKEQIG